MATKVGNGLDLQNQRIQNVGSPSASTDAVTKTYVDDLLAGLAWKQPVRVATTTNGALASAYANGQTVDGVTLTTGMRILVKDQTTGSENGIYTVNASGAPTRATDADTTGELRNATAYVVEGTVNADKAFTQTANDPTVGTTALVFAQVGGGSAYTAGNGLSLTSGTFAVVPKTSGGLAVDSNGVFIDSTQLSSLGVTRKYAGDVPSGSTSATVTHNLNTLDVQVQIYDKTANQWVIHEETSRTVNTVVLAFATTVGSGAFRAVVQG